MIAERDAIRDQLQKGNTTLQEVIAEKEDFRNQLQEEMAKVREYRSQLQEDTAKVREHLMAELAQETKAALSSGSYRNEVEVEVKFVYPLLQLLGFRGDEMNLRVPINIQAGRQVVNATADWVVTPRQSRAASIVVEAKAPQQPLDETVIAQARSYATAIGAPMYIVTNGLELSVYRRGISADTRTFTCTAKELPRRWQALYTEVRGGQ